WDPYNTEKPQQKEYNINTKKCGIIVLDALIKIKNEMNTSLNSRRSYKEEILSSSVILNINVCDVLTHITKIDSSLSSTISGLTYPIQVNCVRKTI
ncbi:hypothetical protein KI387_038054, partial [Taxus chinensis]